MAPTPGPRGVVVRSDHLLRWLLDQPSHEASRVTPTVLGLTGATGGAGVVRDAGSAWLRGYVVRSLVLAVVLVLLLLVLVVPALVESLDGLTAELAE